MKTFAVFMLFALVFVAVVNAQDDDQPAEGALFTFVNELGPVAGFFFMQSGWLPGGETFSFRYSIYYVASFVYHYTISTGELQIQYGCIYRFSEDNSGLPYNLHCLPNVSPDGRYQVTGTGEVICGEVCRPLLVLSDLKNERSAIISNLTDTGYIVQWSEDSSAFLIFNNGSAGGLGLTAYVKVPSDQQWPAEIAPVLLANYSIDLANYMDISDDGQRVLVRGVWDSGYASGLTLWSPDLPVSDEHFRGWAEGEPHLEDNVVAGGSFIPDDDNRILVVLEEGIAAYDLMTHEIEVIDGNINANWVMWSYFSPDLTHIAVYYRDPENTEEMISIYPVNAFP